MLSTRKHGVKPQISVYFPTRQAFCFRIITLSFKASFLKLKGVLPTLQISLQKADIYNVDSFYVSSYASEVLILSIAR